MNRKGEREGGGGGKKGGRKNSTDKVAALSTNYQDALEMINAIVDKERERERRYFSNVARCRFPISEYKMQLGRAVIALGINYA